MQRFAAVALTLVGIALLIYMIVVEDEPGALPLALTIGGIVWYVLARRRGGEGRR